jgi:arylsulfatase A
MFNHPAHPQPGDHGYDWWLATQNNASPSHQNPNNFVRNGVAIGEQTGYAAPLVVNEAIQWLTRERDKARPFFLAVWTHEPHYPIKSDPRFKLLYPELTDEVQREHHANVTQLDFAFGELMKTLDLQQLAANTFVFFTSDNGPEGDGVRTPGRGSTGGLRGRKRDLHEGGVRVPGIARWPGKIPAATRLQVPIIGSDLFPTLVGLGKGELPADRVLDGVDVLALLCGSAQQVVRPQPLYWRLDMAPNAKVAMRVGDWKILASEDLQQFELYNIAVDPAEQTDLKESHSQTFVTMRDQLIQHTRQVEQEGPDWWRTYSADGGRTPEQVAATKAKKGKEKSK